MDESKEKLALFHQIEQHLMEDTKPSIYLKNLLLEPLMKQPPFCLLTDLQKTEQSPVHHPEGNVWNHTLLVVNEAAKNKKSSKTPTIFMWAALLHDIGKAPTTKIRKGKITSYDHEKVGETLATNFLSTFLDDSAFIEKVAALIRYHMQLLFVVNDLSFADIEGMKQRTDVKEVALLGLCDRLGRKGANPQKEEENMRLFLRKCGQ